MAGELASSDIRVPRKIVIFSFEQGNTARKIAVYMEYMRKAGPSAAALGLRARSRRAYSEKSAFFGIPKLLTDKMLITQPVQIFRYRLFDGFKWFFVACFS